MSILRNIKSLLKSDYFFWAVLVIFVLQASWIAVSTIYPMMYDEAYHFGLVEYFSDHYNIFVSNQPPELDIYGDLDRGGSYLYHYLLSYPYRLLGFIGLDRLVSLVLLRLINVAFAAGAIYYFRVFLKRINLSNYVTNISILVYVTLPLTTFLAAHVNYDNLLMLLTALSLLFFIKIVEITKVANRDKIAENLATFFIIGTFASLIKYTFLPLFFIESVIISWLIIRNKSKYMSILKSNFIKHKVQVITKIIMLVPVFLLFAERYIVNIVRYKTIVPNCDINLAVERCTSFGPYGRSHAILQSQTGGVDVNFMDFVLEWFRNNFEAFFTVGGGVELQAASLPVIRLAFLAIFSCAVLALAYYWHQIGKNIAYRHLLIMFVFYVAVIMFQNYRTFLALGEPIAQNGRYLLPLTIPVLALLCYGVILFYKNVAQGKNLVIFLFATIYLIGAFQGGGIITYIIRGNPNWHFENAYIQVANQKIKNSIKPYVKNRAEKF